ncbi:MAG: hypothetical protein QOI56_529, partial [Actinomycetota bacterium]|nr:hypothetical protein [Actinomycetota bacterium]
QGLGAAEVTNTDVSLGLVSGALEPVAMRLISPGHFVGDVTLPVPGSYRLQARLGSGAGATFDFRLRGTPTATTEDNATTPPTTKDAVSP